MEECPQSLRKKKSESKSIGYTDSFKRLVHETPGLLKAAKGLMQDISYGGEYPNQDRVEKNGVYIEKMKIGNATLMDRFKMGFGDKAFFVKRIQYPNTRTIRGDGYHEVASSEEAMARVEDISWAEVVNFQFGFSDGKNSYFVADWNDIFLTTLWNFTEQLRQELQERPDNVELGQRIQEIESKVNILKSRFRDYRDFDTHNMAIDPKTGKYYLFDLNKL